MKIRVNDVVPILYIFKIGFIDYKIRKGRIISANTNTIKVSIDIDNSIFYKCYNKNGLEIGLKSQVETCILTDDKFNKLLDLINNKNKRKMLNKQYKEVFK